MQTARAVLPARCLEGSVSEESNLEAKQVIVLEWDFVNPDTKTLLSELTVVATNFIHEKLAELEIPEEFGFRSVAFKDEYIFITRNDDTRVFECFVGWK